jgi:hypothetical protein
MNLETLLSTHIGSRYALTEQLAVALQFSELVTAEKRKAEVHAFVRAANGDAATFNTPGQIVLPGGLAGSAGEAINAEGVIVGRWRDSN